MVIDLILALILLSLALSGYRRGLLMSLTGLMVVVLSCLGALAAQRAMTPRVEAWMEPRLVERIQPELESQVTAQAQEAARETGEAGLVVGGNDLSLNDLAALLRQFGLDVEGTVSEAAAQSLEPAAAAVSQSLARSIAGHLAGVAVFFGAYLVLRMLLGNVALAVNLVDRLPVVHTFNRAGGAIFGLLCGLTAMVAAAAVLGGAGLLPEELGPLSRGIVALAGEVLA